ncbi:hypothetical protein F5890DRAFT_1487400 [Lentinula detonsa]|uniref:FAD-binding domain-containing protein n=1 Tax=Lentinula detonsa TaxID=2804962 RepID=A0AA38UW81_9AGAR|nr:hypothetical protein F5890DRAFT_1487400 [Lentinula detonsa]
MSSHMAIPEQHNQLITQPHGRLHAIIIGGSITGLSAAIALRRAGFRVNVLEKDVTVTEELDGGCRIAPNLYKILRGWDLESELRKVSSKPETINMLSYESGSYLGSIRWDREVLKETDGEFGLTTYSALRSLLHREAVSQGVCVQFGAKVVALETRSSSPSVTLEDGEILRADLLVGADGVNGLTREYISTHGSPLETQQTSPSRKRTYKGVETGERTEGLKLEMFSVSIPKNLILDNSQLAYLITRRENDMFVWLGHERSAIGFPSGQSGDFSLCFYGLELESRQTRDLHHILRGAEPSLLKLSRLASQTSSSLKCNPIAHENVLDTWIDGSLVVIGEAAHPLPPGSAQSCALSVEDSLVLARLFSPQNFRCPFHAPLSTPYIPALLAAFQSIRYPHCASVQTKEVGIIHYMTMPGASDAERNIRDQGMRARRDTMEIAVVPVPLEIVDYFEPDFSHDMEEENEEDDDHQVVYEPATVRHTSESAVKADDGLEISPEWVEITEVFGYQAEDEAEEWWATWGRYQIWTEASEAVVDNNWTASSKTT